MSLDIRAVQSTGGSSLTITLPKKWVEICHLTKKDLIECYYRQTDKLYLKPHRKDHQTTTQIVIDDWDKDKIKREIIAAYVSGVEHITVSAESLTSAERILLRNLTYRLIGFEIVESTTSCVVIKKVAEYKISTTDYIERIMSNIESMYVGIKEIVQSKAYRKAKDIIERDVEIDRINLALDRQLHVILLELVPTNEDDQTATNMHYYATVGVKLERLADHLVRIAHTILQLKNSDDLSLDQAENIALNNLERYFRLLRLILTNADTEDAHKLLNLYNSKKKNGFIATAINNRPAINILIIDSLERIRGYAANIAEETINQSYVLRRSI